MIEENADPDRGYVLYSRPVDDSDYPAFKIEGVVDAPPEKVIRAIETMLTDPGYVSEGQTREVLEKEAGRWLLYTHFDLPALFSDRDVVATATLVLSEATPQYELRWMETNAAGPGPKEGVVRMPSSRGSWALTRLDDGKTRVVCESHADFGGSLPAWLVTSRSSTFVVDRLTITREIAAGL